MSRTQPAILVVAATVAAVCNSASAHAKGAPERLAVAAFRGPQAGRIQGAVESGLMARYYLVPDFSVERVAKQHGVRLDADSDFGVVGRTLEVTGFVTAQVQKRANWQVRLQVRRGDTGAPVGNFVLADRRLDGLESQIARRAPARVQRLLARAAPDEAAVARAPLGRPKGAASASTEPPRLETGAEPSALAAHAAPEADAGPSAFAELSVEGRMFSRSFSYVQNVSGLPDYRLERALSTALDLTLYPGALVSRALPALGVVGAVEYAPGVKSRVAGSDQKLATSVHGYRVGVKYRVSWSSISIAPQLAYGAQVFQTADPSPAAPDVQYKLVWAGAEGRWEPGARIALLGSVAYLHALSAGRIGDATRFPRVAAQGAAVEVGAAVALLRGLELRMTLGLRRFGLAMHARPGDTLVAGGAVDEISWVGLGLAYRPGRSR
jgi:hypothetical protein